MDYGGSITVFRSGINAKINLFFGSGPQGVTDQARKRFRRNWDFSEIEFSIPGYRYSHGIFPKGVRLRNRV